MAVHFLNPLPLVLLISLGGSALAREIPIYPTGDGGSSGARATRNLTMPAPAALADGDTLTLADASGGSRTFEIDRDAAITAEHVRVDVTGAATDVDVATRLRAAIAGSGLDVIAGGTGAAIALTQRRPGLSGNTPIEATNPAFAEAAAF